MLRTAEHKDERRHREGGLRFIIFTVLLFCWMTAGAGEWSVNGSVQYLQGDYIYTSTTSTYYLSGGLRYRTGRWNAGVTVPLIVQNNGLVSSSGSIFLPSHRGGSDGDPGGGHHGGGMMGGGRIVTDGMNSQYETGIGDIYLSGQYRLLEDNGSRPSVALTANVKLPAASTAKNFGTGEFDYGMVLNLSKRMGDYAGFLDAGYWLLGNPPQIEYRNPFTYGVGLGRFFSGGQYSMLLYYQGYTTILQNYEPPRQASAAFYYRADMRTVLSLTVSAGLSDTSPGFGLAAGVDYQL